MNQLLIEISAHKQELIKAIMDTGIMLSISILAAILIGLPLGTFIYLTRKNGIMENKFISTILNAYVNIVRSFPFLIFIVAMIPITRFVVGTSFGTYASSFPLSLVAIAIYARYVEQSLWEVPDEIIDSANALGATTLQLIFYFLYSEARSSLVLGLTSAIVSFISYSTVMGVIGGGGIGDFAMQYGYQRYNYTLMYLTVILMVIFVQLIQITGTKLAKKLDKKQIK